MTRVSSALLLLTLTLLGCKSGASDQPDTTPPATAPVETPGEATAPTTDDGAAGKVACHLDCSGQERTTYGSTEEEARAAARDLVAETCKPEDGQFFIVCDPPATESSARSSAGDLAKSM